MDKLTKKKRSELMSKVRSKNSKAELIIFRELRKRKIYFAKHVKKIIGTPDIVFRRKKVVVFIDSDFWHGHPERGTMPKTNTEYWSNKIKENKERQIKVNKELKKQGWKVVRLWEYDIKRNLEESIEKIISPRSF